MSWCRTSDDSDERARVLTDQIIAASNDDSPESVQLFDKLTTEALLHMTGEHYQILQETSKGMS